MRVRAATLRHPLLYLTAGFLIVFLVLFPKGGFKLGDTPITWGYLALALSALPLIAVRLLVMDLSVRPTTLIAFASALPFTGVFLYSILQNGYFSLGIVMSDLSGFFVLPVLFLLIYPAFLSRIDPEWFSRWFRFCILTAALWGIFLFFWYPIFGHLIEIPLLTVNIADYGQIESLKHISRGPFLKLISTYNNGNVYGVATLIILPLYRHLEPRRSRRAVLQIALVLTLSRTVWLGLIADQFLSLIAGLAGAVADFPRVLVGQAFKRSLGLAATVAIILTGFFFTMSSVAFLLDTSFGGRESQLAALINPSFVPTRPVMAFTEILYLSTLNLFGISGLLSLLVLLFTPFLLAISKPALFTGASQRAALKGLLLYAFVAASDAAANLIPVLVFYWFAYMTFLNGLPGERQLKAPAAVRDPAIGPVPQLIQAI